MLPSFLHCYPQPGAGPNCVRGNGRKSCVLYFKNMVGQPWQSIFLNVIGAHCFLAIPPLAFEEHLGYILCSNYWLLSILRYSDYITQHFLHTCPGLQWKDPWKLFPLPSSPWILQHFSLKQVTNPFIHGHADSDEENETQQCWFSLKFISVVFILPIHKKERCKTEDSQDP